MRQYLIVFLIALSGSFAKDCSKLRRNSNSKLFCYYSKLTDIDGCFCTHVILPANSDVKSVERVRQHVGDPKILITVNEFNQGLLKLLKNTKVDGLELNLKKLDSKNDITDFISTVRSKLGSDLYLAVSIPAKSEILAKYYDFKALSKHADLFILQTAFLGASSNVTFHPSRLSGIWDMQNTDSIVDLVNGLGAPLSKVIISAPVQAYDFTLQNEQYSAVGSPATELRSISRDELCRQMNKKANWTLERDQDQAAPYIFNGKKWIAFEDTTSIDIKAKYSRIRGLAGLALKDVSQDGGLNCGVSLLETAYNGLSRQARAPRQAILHSLEREILETPQTALGGIHVSPFRISRVIDVEGKWHVIRQDTRTEFSCTRQGYFVHPRSCNRFYRCVKFDQLVDDYSVFEFDCPAGLAFDERVEVCVWPGSIPEGQACAGSSEIAPVPKERFNCPHEPGYYADPENCRWFFACLDHGRSALTAYEFRCPFGLVFDSDRLMCEWSWLVPKCVAGTRINVASEYYYGGYSGSGNYQTANVLQTYDGLGALGLVKLDGVRGEIQQPIINSNVGIYGYQGIGGLGQQATQSLYKAGLIKTNIGVPHTIIGTENINVIDSGAYNNARVNAYAVTNEGVANSLGEGSSENRYLSGVNSVGAGLISNINLNANAAKATLANTYSTVQHSGAANLNYGSAFGAKSLNAVATNLGAYQNHQYVENNNEAQAQVSSSQNLYQNSDIGSVVIANQAINAFDSSSGALYNNQFAANTQAVKNTGISGSVDIVGGGYSAVGEVNTGVHTSNVHIAQPNAYSVVPTVTSVPIPSLNEGKGFEVHQGSVIANVPELQLRIQNSVPSVSSVVHSGNYVRGSTPRPIIQEQQPIIAVDENSQTANGGANSFTYHTQDYSKTGGYIYDKPSVAFVEGNQELINKNNNIGLSVSTIRPNVIVQQAVTPVVDIQQSNQYIYSQQHAAIPKVTVSVPSSPVTIQPHISESYSYSTTSNPVSFIQQQPQRITPVIQAQIPEVNVQPQVILEQSQVSVSSTPRPLGESYSTHLESTYSEGYQYPQPAVQLTAEPIRPVQPKIISSYSIKQPVNPLINTQLDIGQKQVRVESPLYINHINNVKGVSLSPVTYTTARPNTVIHNEVSVQPVSIGYQEVAKVNVAPAVVTQYHIQKPSVTRYTYKDSLLNTRPIKPALVPVISSTPQPINVNYFSANQEQNTAFAGYSYPKPETVFIEEPKSVIQQPVQEVPFVKKTAYITGHSNQNFNEQGNYNYINNIVSSTPATPVVPVVVENYQAPIDYKKTFVFGSTPKPTYISTVSSIISKNEVPQEFYFYDSRLSTSKPTIIEERPAVPIISVSSTPKPRVRYSYLKPTIVSSTENYIPVQTVTTSRPITKYSFSSVLNEYNSKPIISTPDTFVSSYSSNTNTGSGYSYPKPAVVFEEKPAVPVRYVSSTETYVPVHTVTTSRPITKYSFSSLQSQYQSKPIIPTPDAFVSSYSSIPNNEPGYSYSKPAVVFEEKPAVPVRYVSSTETYVPVQTVTTSRPIAKYSFSSLDGQYAPKPIVVSTPAPFVSTYSSAIRARPGKLGIVENYQAPIVLDSVQRNEFQEVNSYSKILQSTPKPTFISTISSVRPKVTVTSTESPFYYYDSRLTTPSGNLQNEYLPAEVVSTTLRPTEAYSLSTLEDYSITPTFRTSPPRTRIRVTTSQPEAVYVRQRSRIRYTSTTEPSISTYPSNEYLPVEKLSTISLPVAVTTPSREYLPIRSRVTTEAIPVDDEVEISTRRLANIVSGKTIIKQNDFLPMLSAKLGAQCTCTSNKLNVRKKQKIIVVEDEEDDDGYVVENNDNNGIVVENYEYEPQKVIDITPTPQVYIKSSSSEPILTSTYRIRSRQRGRPKIEAYEEEDDRPSDREIVKAVKTGLKLVKQAAKEGAKEGTEEALQENNLRVRDKIDCQRAGLFRHPTQCNKFYSCKWDCTKNKYVVHSFNCPIHLTFDSSLGACNWPSQGPACAENTLLTIQ